MVINTIRAFANSDQAYVIWESDAVIPDCAGFALFRRMSGTGDLLGTPVNTRHGFPLAGPDDQEPRLTEPSTKSPIADFSWCDYDVRQGDKYEYQAVATIRQSDGSPQPVSRHGIPWSNPVTITAATGTPFSAYFNRGVVSSQWLAHRLRKVITDHAGRAPVAFDEFAYREALRESLTVTHSDTRTQLAADLRTQMLKIRMQLAADLRTQMLKLLKDALQNANAHVYAALFLLNDRELIDALVALGARAHLILANGRDVHSPTDLPGSDATDAERQDENAAARAEVRATKVQIFDRKLKQNHLGHNKFFVVCEPNNRPLRVWTGSGNWTVTGLCTQANNGLVIEDPAIARAFKDQWDLLKADRNEMGDTLRSSNATPKAFATHETTLWFAPLPESGQSAGSGGVALDAPAAMPVDLAHAAQLIRGAQQGILFLLYVPAARHDVGSLYDVIREQTARPELYVRGVINEWLAEDENVAAIRNGSPVPLDPQIVVPRPIAYDTGDWVEEPAWFSHALVHSKLVVVDPLGARPVVITGAHNLGPFASINNDENLVIVEGNGRLAEAYAVNVIGLYRHYRLRYRESLLRRHAPTLANVAGQLEPKPLERPRDDTWQTTFVGAGARRRRELDFWLR